jgi:hypothetical protein
MALPGITENVLDGNLGLQPGSNSQVTLWMGCCTAGVPNTLATYGDIATMTTALGAGELLEASGYGIRAGTPPVMVMPMNPGTRGGVGAVTHTGPGALAITLTIAPHVSITITCTTGGTIGTAAFAFALGSGAASAPVVSQASWTSTGFLVPGTYCTVVFTAGSYISGGSADIYTISTLGAIAHPQGAGPAVPTFTASPVDAYSPKITITTGGAVSTSQFTYALDGLINANAQQSAVVTSAASYALPGTGIVLAFSGSATAGDTYTFQSVGPQPGSSDLTAALTALQTTLLNQATYSQVILLQTQANAAGWASTVATLETARLALFALGVYVDFYVGGPTLGTVLPNAGSITVDVADTDSVVIAARAGMSGRPVPCAGDWLMNSPVSGIQFRRNAVMAAGARGSKVSPSQDVGAFADGGIASAVSLFRDENATQGFYTAGITCLRTYGAGSPIFLTRGLTAQPSNSDYYPLANSRVMNKACGIARLNAQIYINAKIPTTTRNGQPGVITESKAQEIENKISAALRAGLVDSSPQDAVGAACIVTRTNNVFSTGTLILTVAVQPYAYAPYIVINLGLTVSSN